MVLRDSYYPRLPRKYWGQLIYATPGCGKTYVANKYRDVVDGDDLIVAAIEDISPGFEVGHYNDPRHVIFRYFRYINFSARYKWKVYNAALRKMRQACYNDDVVLFGTLDLIDEADMVFISENHNCIRSGFNTDREQTEADYLDVSPYYIDEFLDNSLQRARWWGIPICQR